MHRNTNTHLHKQTQKQKSNYTHLHTHTYTKTIIYSNSHIDTGILTKTNQFKNIDSHM